ncbi:Imm49 family immunity protein [Streptomyces sp. RerS4]|uniref:Imm49 family immunity protein n=1 Tax=Streptomyces sp. RerS4 TaxID=2942449 RepID=UPI00201C39F9|nr:Imm49 family immunity protein [Streptomyces sp. RerS4]UQX04513.1 immunity 49 family protein [Streptomyces sp. RerS4]
MHDVTPHQVSGERMAQALEDIKGRAFGRWHWMQYGGMSMPQLETMRDELLDHAAARLAHDPRLDAPLRDVLHTAAQCSLGLLSIGCFPNGDQEIPFPLIDEQLSSEDITFGDIVEDAPTAATWVDTFAICLVSGLVWEWKRVIGGLLREDFAPAIRKGVPYSDHPSVSDPAHLAQMDALCEYLTLSAGHLPRDWPTVVLCKPGAAERAEASRKLDAAGPLTSDQRLLRTLLDDDRQAFEQALAARLREYRAGVDDSGVDGAGVDGAGVEGPAPRSLLPLGTLAVAALAVQAHGWELGVRSGYLPPALLGSPEALRPAAAERNDLGGWVAR